MTLALISTCVGGRRAGAGVLSPVRRIENRDATLPFTHREREVLEAVIKTGYCTRAAEALGLSHKTVEIHMLHMRTKAVVDSNYQLIAAYVQEKCTGGFE